MMCEYLDVCGGCTSDTLDSKLNFASDILGVRSFEIFTSKLSGFRSRCELSLFVDDENKMFLGMRLGTGESKRERKRIIPIDKCINLVKPLQESLRILINHLNSQDFIDFRESLFSLEALYTQNNSLLLTLIYHRNIDESWAIKARELRDSMSAILSCDIQLIGRSRGVKIVLESDFVIENINISGRDYMYYYKDAGFTQPNTDINKHMIEWVLKSVSCRGDLLELYCGCGNFTFPLASKFNKVFATEISKSSIDAAINGMLLNKISNIEFVRLSGDECIEALTKQRRFNRLSDIDLDTYNFGSVFVDPPRAGLGDNMCRFISNFEQIIYISCNPISLRQDLEILRNTHEISRFAFFDQFPHTKHLECGVILHKK